MPRAGLDSARVVAEGAALADEVGITNVTLAAIAARLGVKVPSLYKHIDSLDALHQAIAVTAREQLTDVLSEAASGGLNGLAEGYLGWARRHPGLYPATLRAPDPSDAADVATSERAVAVIYGLLSNRGLTDERAIDATRLMRATLHGFVALEAAGGFGLPRDVDRSVAVAVTALERAFADWP
jgi:AcrR family transcriptional regulator